MPMETPEPVAILTANCWQIVRFEGDLSPDRAPSLRLWIAAGQRSDDGAVRWYHTTEHVIGGTDLAQAYGQAPQGATMYEALKYALYAYAQQAGYIPTDAALRDEGGPHESP